MKFKSTFTVLVLVSIITLSQSQHLNETSNDVCVQNQCQNLLSSEVFKGINEIKVQQEECYRNCKDLDLQCVQSCISSLYNHQGLQRIKTCFENQCIQNTLMDNMQTLRKLILGVGINGECTASLRYSCRPYIEAYDCPRRCLLNWIITECIPCAYDYC